MQSDPKLCKGCGDLVIRGPQAIYCSKKCRDSNRTRDRSRVPRPCSVEGCERDDHRAHGLCSKHYRLHRLHGDATPRCKTCEDLLWFLEIGYSVEWAAARLGKSIRKVREHMSLHADRYESLGVSP